MNQESVSTSQSTWSVAPKLLEDLLIRWEDLRDQGHELSAEQLCQEHPHLLVAVRERIKALREAYHLMEGSGETLDPLPALIPSESLSSSPVQQTLKTSDGRQLEDTRPGSDANQHSHSLIPMSELNLGNTPELETLPPAPPSTSSPEQQATFAGYEILRELGRGGMGVVYQARDPRLKRVIALKMILGKRADDETLRRFQLEAESVGKLRHPNVVQIYEVGETDGQPFCALEFVEGGSLDARIRRAPQPPREAATLMVKIARGMQAAHSQGIVHRDLKPANILLDSSSQNESGATFSQSEPKISDFGLAKQVDAEESRHTQDGSILGTPSYMAPEQASGDVQNVGPLADVYALGAILYEMLTGRPPFCGQTPWDTIEQVLSKDPIPPRRFQEKCDPEIEAICLTCLHKEPARRYASAEELALDLERYLDGRPIQARRASWREQAIKWARRHPATTALIGVVVLALFGLFGLQQWNNFALDHKLKEREKQVVAQQGKLKKLEIEKERRKQTELLEKRKADTRDLIQRGQLALEAKKWNQAGEFFTQAKKQASGQTDLKDLHAQSTQLLSHAQTGASADQQKQTFAKLYQDALLYLTRFTGRDLAEDAKDVEQVAAKALAVYGLVPGEKTTPVFDVRFYTGIEQQRITEQCSTLLVVLSKAGLMTSDGNLDEARLKKAEDYLDWARKLGHVSKSYHLRRAKVLEAMNKNAEAEQERKLAQQAEATTAVDYFLIGNFQYEEHQYAQALQSFDHALYLQPDHFWSQYFQAVCYLKMPARSSQVAEGNYRAAKAALTAMISRNSDFVWSYLLRGYASGQLGEIEQAEKDFAKALTLHPGKLALHTLYSNRGAVYVLANRFEDAASDFQKAVQLYPDQYQSYANHALALEKQDRFVEAEKEFGLAIQRADQVPNLYRHRARIRARLQKLEQAQEDIEHAIHLQKNRLGKDKRSRSLAVDLVELAKLLRHRGKADQALEACEQAFAAAPNLVSVHRLRGELYLTQGRKQASKAKFWLSLAIKLGKKDADLFRQRALAHALLNEHAEAVEDYTLSLGYKADAVTHVRRGWAYLILKAPALAKMDFDRAIDLNPELAIAYNARGYVLAVKGEYQKAVADANKAIDLGKPTASLFYEAARVHAQASLQAGKAGPRYQQIQEQYVRQTVELLELALEKLPKEKHVGFFRSTIETDSALNPIRRSIPFLKFLQAHGWKAKK